MKQLLAIFHFDVKRNIKNYMGVYMIIMPVVILLVLKSFLPSVENFDRVVAIVSEGENAVDTAMIEHFQEQADVKIYPSIERMEQELRGTGTAEGLYWDPVEGQYVSVLERSEEGNSLFSFAAQIIRQRYHQLNYPDAPKVVTFTSAVPEEISDRSKISPVATMGGSIFLVYMTIISAFIIGLGIVNDKEEGTDRAIRVSPVSKFDYILGKSIQPLLVIAIFTIISLAVLGLLEVNIFQVYLAVLVSFPITLLFGLVIGALGKNETEAMGFGKVLSTIVMLAILGGTLLPDSWQWIVWWIPFYWMYDILEEIIIQVGSWGSLAWKSVLLLGITALYFILLRKRISKGLS
ncbi:ABC transporter permease [Patescibacteria group bacterium]|nr:ABC transporter permease [Patescibacteria group bacterium]